MSKTHYDVLGVTPDAEGEVIAAAFRALIKKYHPDGRGPSGVNRAKEINLAYDVLQDPESRRRYDQQLGTGGLMTNLPSPTPDALRQREVGTPTKAAAKRRTGGWWLLAGVAGLVWLGSRQTSSSSPPQEAIGSDANLMDAGGPLDPDAPASPIAPPNTVDSAYIKKAGAHFRLAFDAEGAAGAMIYSENCFASLKSQFSWTKLDQCGAFDALAVSGARGIEPEPFSPEAEYLSQPQAEGRYVAAAASSQASDESVRKHFALVRTAASARVPRLAKALASPPHVATNADDGAEATDSSVIGSGGDEAYSPANTEANNMLGADANSEE